MPLALEQLATLQRIIDAILADDHHIQALQATPWNLFARARAWHNQRALHTAIEHALHLGLLPDQPYELNGWHLIFWPDGRTLLRPGIPLPSVDHENTLAWSNDLLYPYGLSLRSQGAHTSRAMLLQGQGHLLGHCRLNDDGGVDLLTPEGSILPLTYHDVDPGELRCNPDTIAHVLSPA